jgi:hypothetical protein
MAFFPFGGLRCPRQWRFFVALPVSLLSVGTWRGLNWSFSEYNEIQKLRSKSVLIDYKKLQGPFGAESYDQFRNCHKGWVEQYLSGGGKDRIYKWTDNIAVGSRSFELKVKASLGLRPRAGK